MRPAQLFPNPHTHAANAAWDHVQAVLRRERNHLMPAIAPKRVNNYDVIASAPHPSGDVDQRVVLCFRPEHSEHDPYVTWMIRIHPDHTIEAYWGHYLTSLPIAVADLYRRSGQVLTLEENDRLRAVFGGVIA